MERKKIRILADQDVTLFTASDEGGCLVPNSVCDVFYRRQVRDYPYLVSRVSRGPENQVRMLEPRPALRKTTAEKTYSQVATTPPSPPPPKKKRNDALTEG